MSFCKKRRAGVLLHLSSLPSPYATGVFGSRAVEFAKFLADCGFSIWQMLPFTTVDGGNSPYASESAFAGYPAFIDPDGLVESGLVTAGEAEQCIYPGSPYTADYAFSLEKRMWLLRLAYSRFDDKAALLRFARENPWVEAYSLYKALKKRFSGVEWWNFGDFSDYSYARSHKSELSEEADFHIFVQYVFAVQWNETKKKINALGVSLLGDIPMYVSHDSADVWSNPSLFSIDPDTFRLSECAGVPPDYFSADGQLWGNPLYRWDEMKKDGYFWWLSRLDRCLTAFDAVRIDHFRGFASYWAIPADAETARQGSWRQGPREEFFRAVSSRFGSPEIIAEDLGVFGDDVSELLRFTGFPGIRVVQFGFSTDSDSTHLPHNYPENCVAYVGTHDNNTLLGWLWEAQEEQRRFALSYCGFDGGDWGAGGMQSPSCRRIIETVWRSHAAVAIISFQDMCGFGSDARMNTPGVPLNNWRFRTTAETIDSIDREYFRKINRLFSRTK